MYEKIGTIKIYTKKIAYCRACPECKWEERERYMCKLINSFVTQSVVNKRIDRRCPLKYVGLTKEP